MNPLCSMRRACGTACSFPTPAELPASCDGMRPVGCSESTRRGSRIGLGQIGVPEKVLMQTQAEPIMRVRTKARQARSSREESQFGLVAMRQRYLLVDTLYRVKIRLTCQPWSLCKRVIRAKRVCSANLNVESGRALPGETLASTCVARNSSTRDMRSCALTTAGSRLSDENCGSLERKSTAMPRVSRGGPIQSLIASGGRSAARFSFTRRLLSR